MFYAELHALLTAGLDFSAAFRLLIEGEGDRRTKALLEELYAAVVRGLSLAEAMRRMLGEEGYTDTEVREDLNGKPRMTCSRLK